MTPRPMGFGANPTLLALLGLGCENQRTQRTARTLKPGGRSRSDWNLALSLSFTAAFRPRLSATRERLVWRYRGALKEVRPRPKSVTQGLAVRWREAQARLVQILLDSIGWRRLLQPFDEQLPRERPRGSHTRD